MRSFWYDAEEKEGRESKEEMRHDEELNNLDFL